MADREYATEIWRAIETSRNYEVSSFGRVRRADNKTIKTLTVNTDGYAVVGLWDHGTGSLCYVHDLVSAAFIGPKPKGWTVNHIDACKLNNRPSNLEYATLADNARHAWAAGLCLVGELCPGAKLSNDQAREIKRRVLAGERGCDLSREFNISATIVSEIKHGYKWAHIDSR